jgi:hypothetical protein
VTSSGSQDEMYLVVLTKDGQIMIYDLALERRLNTQERHMPNEKNTGKKSSDSIDGTQINGKKKQTPEKVDPY